jgi:thiamine-phosphate pyrophosphorylase
MKLDKTRMIDLLTTTGLYLVTEDAAPSERRLRAVEQAIAAGARVVQLRDKGTPKKRLLDEALAMKKICARLGAVFVVNDDAALAWACDADGLHIGQDDLPPIHARRLLGEGKLIGLSVSTLSEAVEADSLPVDYIGVGAIYATPTKVDAELGGLDLMREVRCASAKPLVGIGGIDATNAPDVFAAGADAVAVVRGVFGQQDVPGAVHRFLEMARTARATRGGG